MNIYVGHSSEIDYIKDLYKPIKDSKLVADHKFVYPHESGSEQFDSLAFFKSKCNLLIAEVSNASTGLGIEIGWADAHKIPVIYLHKKDTQVSTALSKVSDSFIEYYNGKDMIGKLSFEISKL